MQRRKARGQALVEFAVLLPLLLLLLLGVEETGRLAYTAIVARGAAHAGALYGAQSSITAADYNGMAAAARADAPSGFAMTAAASHVCTCGDGSAAPNCALSDCGAGRLIVYAKVDTTATFTPVCGFLGWPAPMQVQG